MKKISFLPLIFLVLTFCSKNSHQSGFVKVSGTQFILDSNPYRFVGTNFWYGAYLGMPENRGDRGRLLKELDALHENGIDNLRILAASELMNHTRGSKPSMLNSPTEYNQDLLLGLDFLLDEMAKRDMKAVIFLNNFWEWSGGMTVWSEWFGGKPSIDPSETGDWSGYMNQSAEFYRNEKAQIAWQAFIKLIITRKNSINGKVYKDDPTIMAWQLSNEPRPGNGEEGLKHKDAFISWIHESSKFIKELAPHQLVSTGNEGIKGSLESAQLYLDAHKSEYVDYLTFQMWAKNWGWFKADDMEGTFPASLENAKSYILEHISLADSLHKPIVLSEFGLGRDLESLDLKSPVTYRNRYYQFVFSIIENKIKEGRPIAGSNFWSWGGLGIPKHEDGRWRPGHPFVGDPPQEPQGLNSVFASDKSTLEIIKKHAEFLQKKSD